MGSKGATDIERQFRLPVSTEEGFVSLRPQCSGNDPTMRKVGLDDIIAVSVQMPSTAGPLCLAKPRPWDSRLGEVRQGLEELRV